MVLIAHTHLLDAPGAPGADAPDDLEADDLRAEYAASLLEPSASCFC